MVRLKERKLIWALSQKNKKNEELAFICGIKARRFRQLKAEYKRTGLIPKLIKTRGPKTMLTEDEKGLIDKALAESLLSGAASIRLYIAKYYHKKLPRNKIHSYLLSRGVCREDEKKKKQRKYCRYEREHSFSLVHLDWHESKAVVGKQLCIVEDDASRLIIAGGEYDYATAEYSISLMKQAIDRAYSVYSAPILEVNTDKGSQFYANKKTDEGEKGQSDFELFLQKEGIKHIPSKRNHPQTNGKQERWFRTYEENRLKFRSFDEFIKWYNNKINLGLNRREGVTPNEAVLTKLRTESFLGMFLRRFS